MARSIRAPRGIGPWSAAVDRVARSWPRSNDRCVETDTPSPLHALVLAGGQGVRLGTLSKADLHPGGRRLLDRVLDALTPFVSGTTVVVAPESVVVPPGVRRTMESPAGGGPLAGIGAGLAVIAGQRALRPRNTGNTSDDRVVVCSVDTPGVAVLVPRLLDALARAQDDTGTTSPTPGPAPDGAVILGGSPEPFRQYLQGVYRLDALAALLGGEPTLHGRGVARVISRLRLVEVDATAEECRDIDTVDDVAWWDRRLRTAVPQASPSCE